MENTENGVNVPLLRQTLDYIKTHPQEWDQEVWRQVRPCGTVACFAGWACALNGDRFNPDDWDFVITDESGVSFPIEDRAREILGLTIGDADWLFDGGNTLDDLEQIVEELCGDAS